MGADGIDTQEARTSAEILLTKIHRNIPGSAASRVIICGMIYFQMSCKVA